MPLTPDDESLLAELPADALLGLKIRVSGDPDGIEIGERVRRFEQALDLVAQAGSR